MWAKSVNGTQKIDVLSIYSGGDIWRTIRLIFVFTHVVFRFSFQPLSLHRYTLVKFLILNVFCGPQHAETMALVWSTILKHFRTFCLERALRLKV